MRGRRGARGDRRASGTSYAYCFRSAGGRAETLVLFPWARTGRFKKTARLMDERSFGFRTRALHAGTPPDGETGARALPLHLSTSFVFDSTEHAAELFALRTYGNIYTRIGNPTVAAFEEKLASLEGGLGAVATASGLAAQLITMLSLAQSGDHIVASANLYGGTVTQFSRDAAAHGDRDDVRCRPAIPRPCAPRSARTREPSSPRRSAIRTAPSPISRHWPAIAHAAGVPLIVDNTFATPYLCRPIEHGADIVVHSATKFIGGHGTVIGGAIVESGRFPWNAERHPLIATPSPGYHGLNFAETFGEYAFLQRARVEVLRDVGASISPMNAWLLVQGLETLAVRMPQHVANARAVASFLHEPRRGRVGRVRRSARQPRPRARRALSAAGRGRRLHVRLARRARSGPRLHRSARAVEPPRERRRREESRDPSGVDDAPAALRRRAARGGRECPTWCGCRSASRTRTT